MKTWIPLTLLLLLLGFGAMRTPTAYAATGLQAGPIPASQYDDECRDADDDGECDPNTTTQQD